MRERDVATGLDRLPARREVGARDAGERRLQDDVGVAQLVVLEALAHDREGLQQHARGVAGRRCLRGRPRCRPRSRTRRPSGARDGTGIGAERPPSTYSRRADPAPAGTPPAPRSTRAPPCRCRRCGTGCPRRCRGRSRRCRAGCASARCRAGWSCRARIARAPRRGSGRGPGYDQSAKAVSSIASAIAASSRPFLPDANSAATRLPAEVPTTRSGAKPFSSSAWMTPMWAKPRAAPPPSARPMRGRRGGAATTTGGAATAATVPRRTAPQASRSRPPAWACSRIRPAPARPGRRPRRAGHAAGPRRSAATGSRRARPALFPYAASEYAPDEYVVRGPIHARYSRRFSVAERPLPARASDSGPRPIAAEPTAPTLMYRYDEFDRTLRAPARGAVPRPARAPPRRPAAPTTTSARCACRTAGTCSATRRCCASPCPTAS